MSSKINISIPKPCHENWQKMTPLEKGRFCDSCQKQVFDFTKSSDTEILQKFNSEKNICGRFLKTQLERDIVSQKKKSSFWIAGASGILSFLSLGNQEVFSQEVKIEQTENTTISQQPTSVSNDKISGNIRDSLDILPGVTITNNRSKQTTSSDFDGNFSIKAYIGDTLTFEYMGMESQTLTIQSMENISIFMKEDPEMIDSIIYTVGGAFKSPTFFGRIFRSIGNIFK
ncbi:carboxypeptidase-like regulatory domain-containing protein [Flavobacterium qiangtangense]|uniref:Carboxypeptidase-like regulatory domain-containing protein n=1 Tax=Flavobacterium qiangtangense TaxID=1442595 RepID=A0ABW1PLD6_9FLAO